MTPMEPKPLQQINRTYVLSGRRKLSYFAGCDYFRLASHPQVLRAMRDGLEAFGLNVAASRLTTGHHAIYEKLEAAVAKFFESDTAVLISSGYMTNLAVAQALTGSFSHVLMDEKAHPSLADAAEFLNCPVLKFKHRNVDDLAVVLQRCGPGIQPILLTDGMFSHDGSIAPLKQYRKLLPRNAWIMLDDAHGAGTLGATGKGTVELEDIDRKQLIQCITLSKAFGAYGGAIICDRTVREKIFTRSRLFVGNTPLPLPLANAAMASIKILKQDKTLRRRLEQNAAYVKSAVRKTKWPVSDSLSPVVPILPGNEAEAETLKARCLANQVYPSFIKYPGGPMNGYFRFVISSEHTKKQLDALIKVVS